MPTETLVPDGSIFVPPPNLAAVGEATVWEAVAAASDSSYAQRVNVSTAESRVSLGTFSLGTRRTVSLTVRVRHRSDDGVNFVGRSATAIAGSTSVDVTRSTASTTFEWAEATAAASLSQAEIDDLFVRMRGGNLRFSQVRVDVLVATQPTTNITSPTGNPTITDTTAPTIEWGYTAGDDGGSQSRYHVKVFTQTQVAAVGFDVDTTTPVYDSGVVLSSSSTHTIAEPLANGEDYTVFVRTAQTINGQPHWSEWDSETFTINVSTADVDTVTATATNATASIEITVARDGTSEDWDAIEVQRSVNGGDWEPVRGANGVDATGDANSFVVDDYEAPNGVDVHYRARATRLAGFGVTGAWVQTAATTKWESGDWWIKDPEDSPKNTTFTVSNGAPWTTTRRQGVHQVLGARRPIVTSDTRSDPRFPLVVLTLDGDEEDALDALTRSSVVLIQSPTARWGSRYAVILGDVAMGWPGDESDSLRVWPLSCVEVAAPADPLAGSGLP